MLFYMTDSERVTMTSYQRFIVTFYLWCMVSEITRFYCKPEKTSSWFLRHVSLYAILHDGFWKSDYDFLRVFPSNFLFGMHGFRDTEVLLQDGYDVIVISPPGGASRYLRWRILKSDHDFLIAFHSNFLSVMHGFRDNEVLLQAGYDVTIIYLPGVASRMLKKPSSPFGSHRFSSTPRSSSRLLICFSEKPTLFDSASASSCSSAMFFQCRWSSSPRIVWPDQSATRRRLLSTTSVRWWSFWTTSPLCSLQYTYFLPLSWRTSVRLTSSRGRCLGNRNATTRLPEWSTVPF